jgi:hypothetical protein
MLQGSFLGSRLHSEETVARALGPGEINNASASDPKAWINESKECISLALPRLLYVVSGILHVAIVGENGDLLEEFVAEGETPSFGQSCFVYGTKVLAGAPNDGVYMYTRGDLPTAWAGPTAPSDSGQLASPWSLSKKLPVPSDAFDSDFGWSVWMQGDYVAVGAPLLGRTYVMDARTGAVVDTLPSGGWDISGSNGLLAVADPVRPPPTNPEAGNGMVLIVRAEGLPWVPVAEVPCVEQNSLFGFRVALVDEILVVAAPVVSAVYLFQGPAPFALVSTLQHDEPRAKFGNALALQDDLLIVSDLTSPLDGHVYAYPLGGDEVEETLEPPAGHREKYAFWRGLAMDADIIAAGAYNEENHEEYKVQLYGWSRRRSDSIPTPLPTVHTPSPTPYTTSTTEAPPSTFSTTRTTTARVATTRLSTTTSTTTSMTPLPTNFTGVANPAQDCKALPIEPDKAFCHKNGKVFRWVGMGAEVGVGCTMDPSEDCCGKFVAEVIACCKDDPGFSLDAYLAEFNDFTCQVVGQTVVDPLTNTSSQGEKAGDLFSNVHPATSRHRCSFMDLMLECPAHPQPAGDEPLISGAAESVVEFS